MIVYSSSFGASLSLPETVKLPMNLTFVRSAASFLFSSSCDGLAASLAGSAATSTAGR